MVTVANPVANMRGISPSYALLQPGCSRLCFGIQLSKPFRSIKCNCSLFGSDGVPGSIVGCYVDRNRLRKYVVSAERNHPGFNSRNSLPPEPFWRSLFSEVSWSLKALFIFLLEQPGQLKYIEWPSFQSTLKTATLTLVLMALFIVALSSVDTALRFLLGFALRRKV